MNRPPARTFQDCVVWQKAHRFVLAVNRLTDSGPNGETYDLSAQFRSASISIAANIAEGFKKRGRADNVSVMNISQGALEECRDGLVLSKDPGDDHRPELWEQFQGVRKLLEGYASCYSCG
jgi:four helix bundle protein